MDDGAGHSLRAINLEVLSDSVSSSSRVRVKGGLGDITFGYARDGVGKGESLLMIILSL